MRKLVLAVLALATSACVTMPEVYAPPVQRKPVLNDAAPKTPKYLLKMSDPETDAYIVQDIPRNDRGPWRWAGPKPVVRIYLTTTANTRMYVEYSIADATFKDTGPVTLTFLVNDKLLADVRHDKPGQYTFEKVIPPALLKANTENDLGVQIDKPWTAPTDGVKLGFIIGTIGFAR